jgi:hypothetical protein
MLYHDYIFSAGITPMLQITNHVLQSPGDRTKLTLLSFNTTVADIMLESSLNVTFMLNVNLHPKFCASQQTDNTIVCPPLPYYDNDDNVDIIIYSFLWLSRPVCSKVALTIFSPCRLLFERFVCYFL